MPNSLPKGWENPKLTEIGKYINGKAFKPKEWSRKGLPIIRIQNLNNEVSEYNYYDFKIDKKFIIQKGTLLFAWSGTPGTSFGAHIWNGPRAVLNQHIFKVEFSEKRIDKKFFKMALNYIVEKFIEQAHGGAGLKHITKKKFEETRIPLPPLPEQRRIVQKMERLSEHIDKAMTLLDQKHAFLNSLKASILDSAFKGEL